MIFEPDTRLTAESLAVLRDTAIIAVDAWDIGELEAVLPENSLLMYLDTQDGSGFVPGNGDEAVSDAYFRVYGAEPTANALNAYWAVKAFAEYCESGSDAHYSNLEENFSGIIDTDR